MPVETYFADTNLFLRFLTNDVPAQAQAMEQLLGRAARGQIRLVTSSLVIAELVWTLEGFYKVAKADIQDKVLAILNTPGLEIESADILLQAAVWYADKNVDFIDAFNAAWMLKQDVVKALTFDQKHFKRFEDINAHLP